MFTLTTDTVLYLQLVNVSTVQPPFLFVSSKNLIPGERGSSSDFNYCSAITQKGELHFFNATGVFYFSSKEGRTEDSWQRRWAPCAQPSLWSLTLLNPSPSAVPLQPKPVSSAFSEGFRGHCWLSLSEQPLSEAHCSQHLACPELRLQGPWNWGLV